MFANVLANVECQISGRWPRVDSCTILTTLSSWPLFEYRMQDMLEESFILHLQGMSCPLKLVTFDGSLDTQLIGAFKD